MTNFLFFFKEHWEIQLFFWGQMANMSTTTIAASKQLANGVRSLITKCSLRFNIDIF